MQKLKNLLTSSTFKMPSFTREEWDEINKSIMDAEKAEAIRKFRKATQTIPRAFQKAEINATDSAVLHWAAEPTVGLLLQGEVGRGKTYSACAVLLDVVGRYSVRFTTFDNLLRECKEAFRTGESEENTLARFCNVGILCIDDLGKEKATEWSLSILFHVIDTRHSNERPTIVTTNCTGKELLNKFTVDGCQGTAKAIVSRFKDYERVVLQGEDRRGHARRG